jgi:tRNA modification GTPase
VGKSTLFNRIAQREAAIVSPIPGTTRDVIEVHLDLNGYPVTVLDTAGIRESDDPVEQEGVRRAQARASDADLVLWVVEPGFNKDRIWIHFMETRKQGDQEVWLVQNKSDLVNYNKAESITNEREYQFTNMFFVSSYTNKGMNQLVDCISRYVGEFFAGGEGALISRERHRKALEETLEALDRAMKEGRAGREDIIAEEFRLACRALGRLTGRVDVEDILDVIFRDFCIGK